MRCEYQNVCEHYRIDSWYCNMLGGGDSCGTYRHHESERARIKEYMRADIKMLWIMLGLLIILNAWMFWKLFI